MNDEHVYEQILFRVDGSTAIVKLNRPKQKNALNSDLIAELDRAVETIEADATIRAVVFSGEENFAAGADIKEMIEMNPEEARQFGFTPTFDKIEKMTKPTIAAISGFTLGGGLELALVCDFRIAGNDARLGLPEITLGIIPGAGGTQRLPRLIGVSRAKELIFQGTIIDAQKALDYGIINEIADNPMASALNMAGKLAKKPPLAIKAAKQCIEKAVTTNLQTGIAFEAYAWSSLYATADQKEGMRAFVEKRKPVFEGK